MDGLNRKQGVQADGYKDANRSDQLLTNEISGLYYLDI